MPLGNPIRKQNESRIISVLATEGQSVFTVEGGYIINQISVFRNGVRLSNSEDFTAGDGSTVTLNDEANVDDRIEFHVFDRFTVQNAIVGAASSQTISGDLVLTGKLFGNLDVPSINTGIVTTTELDLNGKGDISGDLNVTGVTTTAGGNISGDLNVTGVTTVGKQVHVGTGVSIAAGGLNVTAGISTFQAVQGTTGTFSGDITANGNIVGDNSTNITGVAGVTATTLTGTLQTAAQTNITSLGTLTSATISGDLTIADSIVHSGDTDTKIRFSGADTVNIETGGSERLRVDSTGQVRIFNQLYLTDSVPLYLGNANDLSLFHDGTDSRIRFNHTVGDLKFQNNSNTNLMVLDANGRLLLGTTTAPNNVNTDDFTLATSGHTGFTIRSGTSHDGQIAFSDGTSGADEYRGQVLYNHNDNYMRFVTDAVERLRITSGGRLLIATTTEGHSNADDLTIATAGGSLGNTGITIRSSTTGDGNIFFSDATSGDGETKGVIKYAHNGDSLRFNTAGVERLRINSSGQLLSGVTGNAGAADANAVFGGGGTAGTNNYGKLYITQSTSNPTSGTAIGFIGFSSQDLDNKPFAFMGVYADADHGTNDYPSRFAFWTTPDGSSSATERLRIDSAGRVGINQATPTHHLHVHGTGNTGGARFNIDHTTTTVSGNTASAAFPHNILLSNYNNSQPNNMVTIGFDIPATTGNGNHANAVIVGQAEDGDGNCSIQFWTENNNSIGERLRIASDGRATFYGTNTQDIIHITTGNAAGNSYASVRGDNEAGIRIRGGGSSQGGTIELAGGQRNTEPGVIKFSTGTSGSPTERLRIEKEGDIRFQNYGTLFGTTGFTLSNSVSGGPQVLVSRNNGNPFLLNRNGSDGQIAEFRKAWGAGGSIDVGVNSATFNTSSDYRLKENIVAISDGITRLKTLKPSRFNWIGDTSSTRDGFIAHEVTAVPEAITGTKDEVYAEDQPNINVKAGDPKYQGIDQSKLVPLLTAALQEAIAKIETLETKVAALEGS